MALVTRPELNVSDYENFENAHEPGFAFEPQATAFSRRNAWWAAEAALFSYWRDENEIRDTYARQTGFDGRCFSIGGTQCHLVVAPTFALVAFRGTQPDDPQDSFDNIQFALTGWPEGGKVHTGFRNAFTRIESELRGAILTHAPNRPLWITGHSLGAAIATLAADRLANVSGLYTFGSPLIGDEPFARRFNAKFAGRGFRYVDNEDLVTRVPPGFFGGLAGHYTHVDDQRTISASGDVVDERTSPDQDRDPLSVVNVVRKMWNGRLKKMPSELADHAPVLYATHVWNDLFANHR
jgi:triacylglycerol lipase